MLGYLRDLIASRLAAGQRQAERLGLGLTPKWQLVAVRPVASRRCLSQHLIGTSLAKRIAAGLICLIGGSAVAQPPAFPPVPGAPAATAPGGSPRMIGIPGDAKPPVPTVRWDSSPVAVPPAAAMPPAAVGHGAVSVFAISGSASGESRVPPPGSASEPRAVTATVTVVAAEPGASRASSLMRVLDTNQDGQLSAVEIKRASRALKKLDLDEDGLVSVRELGESPSPAARFMVVPAVPPLPGPPPPPQPPVAPGGPPRRPLPGLVPGAAGPPLPPPHVVLPPAVNPAGPPAGARPVRGRPQPVLPGMPAVQPVSPRQPASPNPSARPVQPERGGEGNPQANPARPTRTGTPDSPAAEPRSSGADRPSRARQTSPETRPAPVERAVADTPSPGANRNPPTPRSATPEPSQSTESGRETPAPQTSRRQRAEASPPATPADPPGEREPARSETGVGIEKLVAGMRAALDKNQDGRLTANELPGRVADKLLERFDKNADRALDANEMGLMLRGSVSSATSEGTPR